MPIVDEGHSSQPVPRNNSSDPHAEKPTKALVGVALLIAIGFAMYGLGTKPQGADTPSQVVARNVAR